VSESHLLGVVVVLGGHGTNRTAPSLGVLGGVVVVLGVVFVLGGIDRDPHWGSRRSI
jgi:hypothetical protein